MLKQFIVNKESSASKKTANFASEREDVRETDLFRGTGGRTGAQSG